ncbi:hypothetical protein FGG08_004262 [Glutinoglossum americanum]|uniref:Protein kinase domain-containing protein n=1 Tax=Glutinoglossum americanum TaxID=1670608 RepID=A0A9P8I629_9PEZI|nr:hypothetical protein FGG08_004262 [Glutinoglossum americanum]
MSRVEELWGDILTAKTHPSSNVCATLGNGEHQADLISFISNSYELDIPLLDTSSPNILRWLGGGTSSTVSLFRLGHKQDLITWKSAKAWKINEREEIAIKRAVTLQDRKAMLNELRILSHPPLRQHANIIDIMGWSVKTDNSPLEPLLIVEASPCGDLTKFILDRVSSNTGSIASVSIDIARGLYALHCSSVIHGDIKSANVLLFANPQGAGEPYTAKLCDFGFSVIASDRSENTNAISLPRSVPYNAPECRAGKEIPFSSAYLADIYSYGMVLWDIWSGGWILRNDKWQLESRKQSDTLMEEMHRSINNQADLQDLQKTLICDILSGCLRGKPEERTRSLEHLLPKLESITPGGHGVDRDTLSDKPPTNKTALASVNSGKRVAELAPLPADGNILVQSTLTLGRRARAAILDSLETRVKADHPAGLFAVHYLLSFCYLTGYGADRNLPLSVEHMAKAAKNGSRKALSILPRYCFVLGVPFPAHVVGSSESGAMASIAQLELAYGYSSHPRIAADIRGAAVSLSLLELGKRKGLHLSTSRPVLKDKPEEDTDPTRSNAQVKAIKDHGYTQVLREQMDKVENRIDAKNSDNSPDINYQDGDGDSLLHYACFFGFAEATTHLLGRGAKPFANNEGITPLHWLSQFPHDSIEAILGMLLKCGADLDAASAGTGICSLHPANWLPPGTPLSWAVAARRKDIVTLLLSHQADPLLPAYKSALAIAANYHENEILELLLDHLTTTARSATSDSQELSLLGMAIKSIPLTDRIIRHGEAYKTAAALTIGLLVSRGYDVAAQVIHGATSSGLRYSILNDHSESNMDIMQCLLENGGSAPEVLELEDPTDFLPPIHCAMSNAARHLFRILMEHGADVNHAAGVRKYTCLHACSRSDPDDSLYFARELLEGHALAVVPELEAGDIDGATPFMLACRFQRVELAKYLLSKGANPYATDNEGYTVTSYCLSKSSFTSLCEILPDLADHNFICHPGMGVTALHHLTEWDEVTEPDALILLNEIFSHCAPDLVNMPTLLNGRTALFSAVRRGNVKMAKLLLEHGADFGGIRDKDGITAGELALAMYLGYNEAGMKDKEERLGAVCQILGEYGNGFIELA